MIPPSTPEKDFHRAVERQKQRLDSTEWVWNLWNWSVYSFFGFSVLAAVLALHGGASTHGLLLTFLTIGVVAGLGLSFGVGHAIDSERMRKPDEQLTWKSISKWRFTFLALYVLIAGLLLVANFESLRTPSFGPTENQPQRQDPIFSTCREAISRGYGPYYKGYDVEYNWYIDRDSDGIVCER